MGLRVVQVDAFTNEPFSGNPAAVCVTDEPLADGLMQAIAAEMNLSETAFLYPLENRPSENGPSENSPIDGGFSLRWFTPTVEVDLCGHATLASAHVLWREGHLGSADTARFQTRSGWLSARQKADGWIEMDFPSQPVRDTHVMPQLIKSLCCQGNIRSVTKSSVNYLVEVHSEDALRAMTPDFDEMKKLPVQGVIVTAAANSEDYDFVSRFFGPSVGINEDPVTGSAHTSLAPYWQARLDKSVMLAQQVSERGGVIRVECVDDAEDAEKNRVLISGQAVVTLKGELQLS